jgi:hypothetical protein
MNSIKICFGSVIVYLTVSTIYGCTSASTMTASGTAGTRGAGGMTAGAGGRGTGGAGGKGTGGAGGKGTGSATGGAGSGSTGPVPNAEAEESGSRIKARWIVGDDGSKQFLTFYDSMLQVECSYQMMSDGKRHCTPQSYNALVIYGPVSPPSVPFTYFQDAACSAPLATAPTGSTCPPQYAAVSENPPACAPLVRTYRYHPVGAKYTGTVYEIQLSSCSPLTAATMPMGVDFFTIGAELPPSTFVGSTLTTDP